MNMLGLLEQAGFRIRRHRADCSKCTGRSRLTVSFTNEVAYCHRCHWTGNVFTVSRELGLLHDPETRARFWAAQRESAKTEQKLRAFGSWRNRHIRELSGRYRRLWRVAGIAGRVVEVFSDCEPAWDALARFYHAEADLSAALDFLTCARASRWLEEDAQIEDVFSVFQEQRLAA